MFSAPATDSAIIFGEPLLTVDPKQNLNKREGEAKEQTSIAAQDQ